MSDTTNGGAKLPSPEELARITERAMEAAQHAADQLNNIGELAVSMAATLQTRCKATAESLVEEAGGIVGVMRNYAQTVLEQGERVAALRLDIENGDTSARPRITDKRRPLPDVIRPEDEGR